MQRSVPRILLKPKRNLKLPLSRHFLSQFNLVCFLRDITTSSFMASGTRISGSSGTIFFPISAYIAACYDQPKLHNYSGPCSRLVKTFWDTAVRRCLNQTEKGHFFWIIVLLSLITLKPCLNYIHNRFKWTIFDQLIKFKVESNAMDLFPTISIITFSYKNTNFLQSDVVDMMMTSAQVLVGNTIQVITE